MTLLDSLKAISGYPIPMRTLETCALGRGLSLEMDVTADELQSKAYNLCKADLLLWLSEAPNVSQGGQSYTLPDAQRVSMRNTALALLGEYGDTKPKTTYGYKGDRL